MVAIKFFENSNKCNSCSFILVSLVSLVRVCMLFTECMNCSTILYLSKEISVTLAPILARKSYLNVALILPMQYELQTKLHSPLSAP